MLGSAGRSIDLPRNLRLSVSYDKAVLTSTGQGECPLPPLEGEHQLKLPGETQLDGWRVVAELSNATSAYSNTSPRVSELDDYTAVLDQVSLDTPLWVRSRKSGEQFQPLGMPQAKKLQDFMVDSKVPRAWRDRVPLVVAPAGIAWVVGWRVADWAKTQQDSGSALHVKFQQRHAGHSDKAVSQC